MSRLKKIIIICILIFAPFLFYYSLSHIFSTLPVRSFDYKIDNLGFYREVNSPEASEEYREWSLKNKWASDSRIAPNGFPFPNYSPDGRFYVTMRYQKFGWLWVMEMYRTSDNKRLGSYASHILLFHGWKSDSSGVYIKRLGSNTSDGGGFWNPYRSINFDRPVKVALVPLKEYKKDQILITVCILIFIAFLWYYSLSHAHTSLTTVLLTPADNRELEGMPAKYRWSSKSREAALFPLHSPDGRFYITMNHKPLIRLWIMEMYRSSDNSILGTYASHHMELAGWSSDSSRLYVQRNGSRWLNLGGPMKAVMVPPKEYVSSEKIE